MGIRPDRHTALWRLVLAFVVLLATTLQVVPRPCTGHSGGAVCPASAAAQCSCSCCTTPIATGRQSPVATAGVYFERMCGSHGRHLLRAIPIAAQPSAGHVSLPSWRVPGLWTTPAIPLASGGPPGVAAARQHGIPLRIATSLLRPPNA
jgi:hypothetical protein